MLASTPPETESRRDGEGETTTIARRRTERTDGPNVVTRK